MKLGMVIRTDRCVGCQTCVITCKVNNLVPGELYYGKVKTEGNETYVPSGEAPNVSIKMMPQQCNHCEDPACFNQCPYNAITKKDTGIVSIDRNVCIGCGNCVVACPYENVKLDIDSNRSAKCTFCEHRVLNNLEPFCVASCPTKARVIGDLSNPNSAVSKLIATKKGYVLQPEKGTKPKIYYVPGQ